MGLTLIHSKEILYYDFWPNNSQLAIALNIFL